MSATPTSPINLDAGFAPSRTGVLNPLAGDTSARKDSFLYARQGPNGKEYYRITLYEKLQLPTGEASQQISLTENQWQHVVEPLLEQTLAKVDTVATTALKSSFQFTANGAGVEKFESLDPASRVYKDLTAEVKTNDPQTTQLFQRFFVEIERMQPRAIHSPQPTPTQPAHVPPRNTQPSAGPQGEAPRPPPSSGSAAQPKTQPNPSAQPAAQNHQPAADSPPPTPEAEPQPASASAAPVKSAQQTELDPVGIRNVVNTCFINGIMQGLILLNPTLCTALIGEDFGLLTPEQRKDALEIGNFIQAYRVKQKDPSAPGPDGNAFRRALAAISGDPKFLWGEHDAGEVLTVLLANPQFSEKLQKLGFQKELVTKKYYKLEHGKPVGVNKQVGNEFYTENTQRTNLLIVPMASHKTKTLEELILNELNGSDPNAKGKFSISETNASGFEKITEKELTQTRYESQFKDPPKELFINVNRYKKNGQKETAKLNLSGKLIIPGTSFADGLARTYILKSCIAHLGSSKQSGHYVACKCENDRGFVMNDDFVGKLNNRNHFLEQANNSSIFRYVLEE